MIHISKRIFQNMIKIANYKTFSKLAVNPPPFTCKPLIQINATVIVENQNMILKLIEGYQK